MRDPYQVLGVARDAGDDEIRTAYRKLAKELHPDLNPGDAAREERFKEVSAAYALLSDPTTRKRFDAGEIDAAGMERAERQFYKAYAGGPEGERYRGGFGFAEDAAMEDILSELFGARGRAGRARIKLKGADTATSLRIGFLDAARGATKRLTLARGETLDVEVPAGIGDGQTLRLAGKGQPGLGGGPPGDAYIEIRITPHAFFTRKDSNVHLELPVTLPEAILGAKIEAPTIDGPVRLTVPEGSNTGTTLRLRGRGIVDRKSGRRGDQYVTLKVVLPEKIDDALAAFVRDWAREHDYDVRRKAGMA